MQSIQLLIFSHYIIIINFIVSLFNSLSDGFNSVILITNKFTKHTVFISDKITYNAEK